MMDRLLRPIFAISIHALLAESDNSANANLRRHSNFYPRSPCGERLNKSCKLSRDNGFLSTLSLRRATYDTYAKVLRVNISIHALLAESDNSAYGALDGASISIHALLAESDLRHCTTYLNCSLFLSTLSLRRATSVCAS